MMMGTRRTIGPRRALDSTSRCCRALGRSPTGTGARSPRAGCARGASCSSPRHPRCPGGCSSGRPSRARPRLRGARAEGQRRRPRSSEGRERAVHDSTHLSILWVRAPSFPRSGPWARRRARGWAASAGRAGTAARGAPRSVSPHAPLLHDAAAVRLDRLPCDRHRRWTTSASRAFEGRPPGRGAGPGAHLPKAVLLIDPSDAAVVGLLAIGAGPIAVERRRAARAVGVSQAPSRGRASSGRARVRQAGTHLSQNASW